jgi:DNA-binding Lrp family transcriptional regulator
MLEVHLNRRTRGLAPKFSEISTKNRANTAVMPKMIDIDRFDRQLLELVRQNNLEPARTLADKVGLSISAVLRRLRRLRDGQVIVADVAMVNPALTGSALTLHVLVRMKEAGRRSMDAFARQIARHAEITAAWEVTGDDDFLLKVQVASMEQYDLFTREALDDDAGISAFKTLITIRTIKEDGPSSRPLIDS